jgi:hypothetical protein
VLVGVVRIVGRAIGHDLGADGGVRFPARTAKARAARLASNWRLDKSGPSLSKCAGAMDVLLSWLPRVSMWRGLRGDQISPRVKLSGR